MPRSARILAASSVVTNAFEKDTSVTDVPMKLGKGERGYGVAVFMVREDKDGDKETIIIIISAPGLSIFAFPIGIKKSLDRASSLI